ncbi:hypothetical protein DVH24_027056 [Malus domestica]|uniref:Uncharacterized protein n=1 Tax=Malus domestica TaxID=3750 RepID=A0A498IQ14_MALDO|nr:hypothetical protein DVH24_027056 [Malus domestica]
MGLRRPITQVGMTQTFKIYERSHFLVLCGTVWYVDGTERSEMRRSVPRLVCLKRVEHAVPLDEFWVNFRSASSPGTTRSTSVEHKIITSPSPSSFSLFPSEGIFALFPVQSRPIRFRSVSSRLHTKRY